MLKSLLKYMFLVAFITLIAVVFTSCGDDDAQSNYFYSKMYAAKRR